MTNNAKTIDCHSLTIIMMESVCHNFRPDTATKIVILPKETNAAGWRDGIRAEIKSGAERFMLIGRGKPTQFAGKCDGIVISDQINVSGQNPLVGLNDDQFGPRFPDVSKLYNPEISAKIMKAGKKSGLNLKKGLAIIPVDPEAPTALENQLIEQDKIAAKTKDVFAGAIIVKHSGRICAGLILFRSVSGSVLEKFLSELN